MPKPKLIDPKIDQIAERVSERVTHLLNRYSLSLPETKRILDARHNSIEGSTPDHDASEVKKQILRRE